MTSPMIYSLVGVCADGISRTLAENLPSFTEAERLRKVVARLAEYDGYSAIIVRSEPKPEFASLLFS